MNLFDLFESASSDVELRYVEDAEHVKPGLATDEVQAYINNKLVGYLKIDRSSEELMNSECGNIYAYMTEWTGQCFGVDDSIIGKKIEDFTFEEAKAVLLGVHSYFLNYTNYDIEQFKQGLTTRDNAIALLKVYEAGSLFAKIKKKRAEYLAYASKPFVAYSHMEKDHRHRGIGTLMYKAAAKWIYDRKIGKGLYASSLQSGDAKGLWAKLESEGLTKNDGDRLYLDGSLI